MIMILNCGCQGRPNRHFEARHAGENRHPPGTLDSGFRRNDECVRRNDECVRRNDGWSVRHAGANRHPAMPWIPAVAGMTSALAGMTSKLFAAARRKGLHEPVRLIGP